uniref:Uncharacterized protein n=1 Tax=Anguilla anguilla TaxID=7936 RepID=A0A0E9SQ39_ANGAN
MFTVPGAREPVLAWISPDCNYLCTKSHTRPQTLIHYKRLLLKRP